MKWNHSEPLFWGLFGAGGVVAAFILPALILLIGIALPLGWLPDSVLTYEWALNFSGSLTGMGFLLIFVTLTLFHCAHRIYHGLHDLGFEGGTLARFLTYGTAAFCSAALFVILLTI